MELRVLGPIEVSSQDTSIPVRGRIGQKLLAVLVISAGRGVDMSRLVEGVWDGDPPDTARRQVRHAASRLRKVLGPEHIEPVADGYRLDVAGISIDARRFERAVREARDLVRANDTDKALAALRTGLRLWRGSPFAGLSGRIIDAESARLDEARLAALEDRIGLELETGEPPPVIGELRQLLSDNPYRQRLTGLLMTALHIDARTPEALDVYDGLRARLADDLGLDPDPALREQHVAILRGDRGLDGPPSVSPSPAEVSRPRHPVAGPRPAQLPVKPAGFVGRAAHVAALDELSSDEQRAGTCVIAGAAGAGKSALAIHWAHRNCGRFPDGQLFINLRGFDRGEQVGAYDALARFIRALQRPGTPVPEDLDEAAGLYRSLLNGKRVLVVLDNARDAAQVRPLLPAEDGCFTVITSRNKLGGLIASDAAIPVDLAPLARAEAVDLLSATVGARRLHPDSAAAQRLAQLCGDLPLALRIAAANLIALPHVGLTDYVAELESGDRLELLTVDGDPRAAVASTFELSFRALEPETRRLFAWLGLLPGEDFSEELAVGVARAAEARTRTQLTRLQTAHLLEQHRPGRYRFHDLVRLYAAQEAERTLDETDRSATVERYIAWHHQRALTLPLAETVNIVAAITTLRDHPKVWHLAIPLQAVVYAGQVPSLTRQLIEAGLRQTRQQQDRAGHSQLIGLLGAWYRTMGDVETALRHGRRAASLAMGEDLFTNGLAGGNLGATLLQCGRYREAETKLLKAWEIADELNTAVWMQATDYFLGILYGRTGEYEKGFRYLADAEDLCRRQPTTGAVANNGLAKARLLIDTGRFAEAEAEIGAVAHLLDDSADNRGRCMYLSGLGDLALSRGDKPGACQLFEEMRSVAHHYDLSFTESEARSRLAVVLNGMGEHDAALSGIEALLNADLRPQGPLIEAVVALAAAVVYNGAGRFGDAERYGARAVAAFGDMPNPLQHGRSLMAVADAQSGLGDHVAAEAHRRRALSIFTELGVPEAGTV